MAEVTTARRSFVRRKRVRAETGAEQAGRARAHAPAEGYRTFPARLAPLLTLIGGGLVALGALEPGVRASGAIDTHEDPRQVGVLMGTSQAAGWVLAALGVALGVLAMVWLGRRLLMKLAASALVALIAGLTVGRLVSFERVSEDWASAASDTHRYVAYHAGLGWGAWFLLLGVIVAAFGVLVGVLREMDLRKGVAG